jgi:uncharacterized RDD family membrane protein YckC
MASADYTVLIPERVSLEYDIAGLGSRGVAVLIDTAIQVGVLVVVAAIIGAAGALISRNGGIGLPDGADTLVFGLAALVLFLVANGYYVLFEIVWNGQTPGKRAVGVRVIRESGYAVRASDAIVRNLVRIVDWLPLAYGLGVTTMLFNSRFRRLGDLAAGTIVIREAPSLPVGSASALSATTDAAPKVLLASADAILLRDFLVRRHELESAPRRQLATDLASSISRRYGLAADPSHTSPEQFIESIV